MKEFEKAVKEYWDVSRAYEGHREDITTEHAIKVLGNRLQYMNPERSLFKKAETLLAGIIDGTDYRPKQARKGTVTELAKKQEQ